MLLYLFIKSFTSFLFAFVSIIPTLETPVFVTAYLPDLMFRIASFNWYLPVYETVSVVMFLLSFTLTWKVGKILLNFFHIDLNS